MFALTVAAFAAGSIPSYGSEGDSDQLVGLNPVPAQQAYELTLITFTATTTGNGSMTFSLEGSPPAGSSINSTTGIFSWIPAEDQDGTHEFAIRVSSGNGRADSQAVTITVIEVNAPPMLTEIPFQMTNQLIRLTFTATATDPDLPLDTLTYSLDGDPPDGASINSTTGVFSWIPSKNQSGYYPVTVAVDDGTGDLIYQTVDIVVRHPDAQAAIYGASSFYSASHRCWTDEAHAAFINDHPNRSPDSYLRTFSSPPRDSYKNIGNSECKPTCPALGTKFVRAGSGVSFTMDAITNYGSESAVTYTMSGAPSRASLTTENGVGSFSWITSGRDDGRKTITFTADDSGYTCTASSTIFVRPMLIKPSNKSPDITTDKQTDTGYVGHTYRYDVNATDGNGDALTYSVTQFVNSTSGTKITGWEMDSATGVLTWGPLTATNMGKYNVTVMVTDGKGSDTQSFTLTVRNNAVPVLTAVYGDSGDPVKKEDDTEIVRFGGTLFQVQYNFTGTDADDDQTFTLSVSDPPSNLAGALTDCETEIKNMAIHESGSVISSGTMSPITGSACVVALNTYDDSNPFTGNRAPDHFTIQLSDGVDAVSRMIHFTIVDHISFVVNVGKNIVVPDSPKGAAVFIEVIIDRFLSLFEDFTAGYYTVLIRCEQGLYREGYGDEDRCAPYKIEAKGPSGQSASLNISGQSEAREPQWVLIANVSNTANVTVYDSDIEPNRVYTYAARVFVGDKASDYIPLGNVTTPPDTPPVITLLGSANITAVLGSPYAEPGYAAFDDYDGNLTDHVVVTGTVNTNMTGTYVLHYDVTDRAGNAATTQNRTVNMVSDASSFITTWRTTSPNESITIPVGGAPGTYTIYWGDGTADADVTGSRVHTYGSAGSHTVHISGDFARMHLYGHPNAAKLQSIDQWGDAQWISMNSAFEGAVNMAYNATDTPDLSSVADMYGMFGYATSFDGDISEWDVSSVADMSHMFYRADSFDGDISEWDVSSVADMSHMFYRADSFDGDISGWNVSSATDMESMFTGATAFDQNLGSWYIVPDDTAIAHNDAARIVGNIAAQNAFLDGQGPVYGIGSGSDSGFFEMDGATLKLKDTPDYSAKSSYVVNVTATGDGIFGTGNSRTLDITVMEGRNNPPVADAGADQTVRPGQAVALNGTGSSDPDGDALSYSWSQVSGREVSLSNTTAATPTFTAPSGPATLEFRLKVTDGQLSANDTTTVTVSDMTPPVITLSGPTNMTIPAGSPYVDPGYTATDDMDGNVTGVVVVTGTVYPNTPGTYTLHYDVSDSSGNAAITQNRTVHVVDATPPTITLKGGTPITIPMGPTFTDPGYTATDNVDGNVTGMVTVTGTVNPLIPGTYTLYYDVSDSSGNAAITQNRTVHVVDATPPTITLKGGATITIPMGPTFTDPGYTATDNVDGNVTGMVTVTGTVNPLIPGTYTLYYDVSDSSGNAAITQNRTVHVVDATPPTITLKGGATITIPMGPTFTDPGYTATDNVDGNVTGMVTVTGTVNPLIPGTYTLYYDVSDSSGNAAITQNRTVHVVDATPPTITLKGGATITIPMGPTFTDPGYTATDNVDGNVTGMVTVTGTVNPLIPGTYTISYAVADSSGNEAYQTRTVTVTPPVDTTRYCNDTTLAQLMASDKYNIMNMMFSSESSIEGTSAADLIIAADSGPTIKGQGGDDCIIGGAGSDQLWGQGGDDMIFGNGGDDAIRGGPGADTIYGGAGSDQLWGLDGSDTIYGGGGDDTIYGGRDSDTIYGGPGADTIRGGPGADTIHRDDDDTRVRDDDDSGDD